MNTRLPPSATETLPIDSVAVSSFWIVPVAGLPGVLKFAGGDAAALRATLLKLTLSVSSASTLVSAVVATVIVASRPPCR